MASGIRVGAEFKTLSRLDERGVAGARLVRHLLDERLSVDGLGGEVAEHFLVEQVCLKLFNIILIKTKTIYLN